MVLASYHAVTSLVDSFLLYVYVPDYFVTARKTYTEVGVVSMRIRTLLKRHGFTEM